MHFIRLFCHSRSDSDSLAVETIGCTLLWSYDVYVSWVLLWWAWCLLWWRSHPIHVHRHQRQQEAVQEEIWSAVPAGYSSPLLWVRLHLPQSLSPLLCHFLWSYHLMTVLPLSPSITSPILSFSLLSSSGSKDADLSEDDIKTIRASLCGLLKYYISKGTTQDEIQSILGYIAAIGDEEQVRRGRYWWNLK